jgi:hypothetical protein
VTALASVVSFLSSFVARRVANGDESVMNRRSRTSIYASKCVEKG